MTSQFRMIFAGQGMSDDLIELEPLLAQYDPGKILIGPLLNLSLGSNFRSFYIAGSGSKVYGSIGLGSVDLEANAQRQRVDIVDKLKSRFRKVVTFSSHLEMAQAVHQLWPNEETVRILELAALEAQPAPAPDRDKGFEGDDNMLVRPGQEVLEAETQERGDQAKTVDRGLVDGPPSQSERAQQQRQSERNQKPFPAAVLGMQSLIPVDSVAKAAVARRGGLASTIFRIAVAGSVVGLLAGIMVPSTSRQGTDEAISARVSAPMVAINSDNPPSQATAPTGATSPHQVKKTDQPAPISGSQSHPQVTTPSTGAAPIATPQSSRVAAAPTGTPPAPAPQPQLPQAEGSAPKIASTSPQSQPPQVHGAATRTESGARSPATQLDADAIAVLINRAEDFMKVGDFASARLLLRRAANAGSARAALMLGATFDPRIIYEIGPIGIEPDVAQARQWYEKAAELGSDDAAQRLARLAQTAQPK